MTNSILWKCLSECQDYFARLGGSGRYETYREWHSPCLVVMSMLRTKRQKRVIQRLIFEYELPMRLWLETGDLPMKIEAMLKGQAVTEEIYTEFINDITERMKFQVREHYGWTRFVAQIRPDIRKILSPQ